VHLVGFYYMNLSFTLWILMYFKYTLLLSAFMCHHNTFILYDSIQDADQHRWDTVTHASILTSLVVSALFGIAGYATFTGNSQGSLHYV